MSLEISGLNWFGVLLASVAYIFLGGLWFAVLFKKPYWRSLGKENEPAQKMAPLFFVGPALCTLVVTFTTAVLMQALHINTYADALLLAATVGLGYLFANTVNIGINPNIPRPLLYGIISGSFNFVGICIAGTILFAMRS